MNFAVGAIAVVMRFYLMGRLSYDNRLSAFGCAYEMVKVYYNFYAHSGTRSSPVWSSTNLSELVFGNQSALIEMVTPKVKDLSLYLTETKDLALAGAFGPNSVSDLLRKLRLCNTDHGYWILEYVGAGKMRLVFCRVAVGLLELPESPSDTSESTSSGTVSESAELRNSIDAVTWMDPPAGINAIVNGVRPPVLGIGSNNTLLDAVTLTELEQDTCPDAEFNGTRPGTDAAPTEDDQGIDVDARRGSVCLATDAPLSAFERGTSVNVEFNRSRLAIDASSLVGVKQGTWFSIEDSAHLVTGSSIPTEAEQGTHGEHPAVAPVAHVGSGRHTTGLSWHAHMVLLTMSMLRTVCFLFLIVTCFVAMCTLSAFPGTFSAVVWCIEDTLSHHCRWCPPVLKLASGALRKLVTRVICHFGGARSGLKALVLYLADSAPLMWLSQLVYRWIRKTPDDPAADLGTIQHSRGDNDSGAASFLDDSAYFSCDEGDDHATSEATVDPALVPLPEALPDELAIDPVDIPLPDDNDDDLASPMEDSPAPAPSHGTSPEVTSTSVPRVIHQACILAPISEVPETGSFQSPAIPVEPNSRSNPSRCSLGQGTLPPINGTISSGILSESSVTAIATESSIVDSHGLLNSGFGLFAPSESLFSICSRLDASPDSSMLVAGISRKCVMYVFGGDEDEDDEVEFFGLKPSLSDDESEESDIGLASEGSSILSLESKGKEKEMIPSDGASGKRVVSRVKKFFHNSSLPALRKGRKEARLGAASSDTRVYRKLLFREDGV